MYNSSCIRLRNRVDIAYAMADKFFDYYFNAWANLKIVWIFEIITG